MEILRYLLPDVKILAAAAITAALVMSAIALAVSLTRTDYPKPCVKTNIFEKCR